MKKISTLYKKDPNDLSRVINEIDPKNEWVLKGEGIPTRKFDGTATAIISGKLYKRYDVKKGKQVPTDAIPCDEPDEITGHWPHWIKCDRANPADKWHFVGFDVLQNKEDGTYELCGEKVQGNPEHLTGHFLIKHGMEVLPITDYSFEGLKDYLSNPKLDIEGIVFHHKTDGRMCKIRKCDFGIKRTGIQNQNLVI
jgi:hypothetical protein